MDDARSDPPEAAADAADETVAVPSRAAPPPAARLLAVDEIEALSGDPSFMTSLARGIAVIRAFSERKRSLTIAQISQKTGIPRAAVRRCLYTLGQLGYVSSDSRNFSLLPKVLSLGHAYLAATPLPVLAQPFLDRVRDTLHEACSLAILDAEEILYVARAASTTRIMSVDLSVGSRLPAYCTSMGRAILAYQPAAELERYLATVELRPRTGRTISTRARLIEALEQVRACGYALVDQELELGLRSLAVPVRDLSGRVVAAMNVSVGASRCSPPEMEAQFLPVLLAASAELGMQLVS